MPANPEIKKLPGGKKRVTWRGRVPRGTQRMILDLPEVRRHLVAERRAVVCEVAPHLKGAGFSQNAIARSFGISAGTLGNWLRRYQAGGVNALVPEPMGPAPAYNKTAPCLITFELAAV